ncbi:MAG TPA: DNA translocase FtsK [Anaeromyxobacteraceae bacterium]|nr:DNA translocase FtsK [Anaeromyxobacteraceae bacterium]
MGKAKENRRVGGRSGNARAERGSAQGTGMRREIAAVVLTAVGLTLFLSLVTFSSLDGDLIDRGLAPASNLVGRVGHYAALGLLRAFGFAAMVLPQALLAFSWKLFRRETIRITAVSAAAWMVLLVSGATLGHLLLASRHLASYDPGGAVGRFLCRRSVALLSEVGTGIAVSASAIVAMIVAVDLKVRDVAHAVWQGASAVAAFAWAKAGDSLHQHREAVAELRAQEDAIRARRAEEEAEQEEAEEERESDPAAAILAAESARRIAIGDDPAWTSELVQAPAPAAVPLDDTERPRRRRRRGEPDAIPAANVAMTAAPEIAASMAEAASATETARAAVAPVETAPEPEPVVTTPPELEKPEIVLSQAMLDRNARKKKEKKEQPAFSFMQSGDVFRLPTTDLLDVREAVKQDFDANNLTRTAEIIVGTLRQHGVDGSIRHIRPGPVVTLYEFSPVAGVKLAKIENLDKELTMALSATRIRIIAPIPGKGVVGIEVPNRDRATVYLREVLESDGFHQAGGLLPLGLGKNIEGIPYCVDLQRMPHLLIAGTTGSGKSVGLNTMILSLLYRQTPDKVRFIMVDPKMTELSVYEDIPHLLLPVVTDPQKAARALQWAVDEMERRTQVLADTGSKDLKSYNSKVDKLRAEGHGFEDPDALPPKKLVVVDVTEGETEEQAAARAAQEAASALSVTSAPAERTPLYEDPIQPPPADPVAAREAEQEGRKLPQRLPYIIVIIDELADLMMTAPREVEISLARLAQKARATGIHLIVATQRPSTDVVTGMIKANFPARISFRLQSRHDSTTIINGPAAENLLGDGDMLVLTATQPLTRVQGAFVAEGEIERVVGFLKEQGKPVFDESILKARDSGGDRRQDDEDDPVYDQALDLVSRMEEVSVSKLQREMRLGYNKAAKIVERMEREGVVGPANGVKPRQVLIRPAGEARSVTNV